MLILALDTATSVVSVALHDGSSVLAWRDAGDGSVALPRHGEVLAPTVDAVLREAGAGPRDLTHVVCGVGPGPFTGLRVGVVTALVLARTAGAVPLGVCTLDAVAAAFPGRAVAVATDARRKEVYAARYDAAGARAWGPRVLRPEAAAEELAGAVVVGRGAVLYNGAFEARGAEVLPAPEGLACHAASMAAASLQEGRGPAPAGSLGEVGPATDDGRASVVPQGLLPPEPLYLRRPDAVPAAVVPQAGVPR